jgi:DNA-binding MarR family transcriptional regulator
MRETGPLIGPPAGQAGLVERRTSTSDRRHNHLHLTAAGGKLLKDAASRAARHEKEICRPFSAAEKKLLLELFGRLRGKNLSARLKKTCIR